MMMKKQVIAVAALLMAMNGNAQISNEINQTLANAKQGSIVRLDSFLTEGFTRLNYKKVAMPGPQYMISDDPEYIRVPEAIVLQEKIKPGTARLYLYNVNGIKEPEKINRKITVVLKNEGKRTMSFRMLKYSSQKPSANYFKIAKEGLADYFADTFAYKSISIKPGEVIAIDPRLEKNIVKYDQLAHGIYEFLIDQPGEISILQTDPKTPGPKALQKIKSVFPSKGNNAGRGLFGVSNYYVKITDTITFKDQPYQIIVADGQSDPWIEGTEGPNKRIVRNAGNYGVLYDIEMDWKPASSDMGLALVTWNSRSGNNKWCGAMANTMVVSGGKFKEGIIQLPSDQLNVKKAPDAILIQVFVPEPGKDVQRLKFTYSPPGASCLPTPLVFIPVKLK